MSHPAGFDPSAEELLRHAEFVRRLAGRLLADPVAADDVAQETLAAALARPPRRGRNPRAWLATVTRNLARRHRRSEFRRAARQARAVMRGEEPPTADVAARLETQRILVEAVRALDEPYRSTIVHRFFDGFGPTEIARRAGVPTRTVETRLRRALERLRGKLDRSFGNDRAALSLALLALCKPRAKTTAAATGTGGLLMTKKLVIAALLLATLGAGAILWKANASNGSDAIHETSESRGFRAAGTALVPKSAKTREGTAAPATADAPSLFGRVVKGDTDEGVPGARIAAYDYLKDKVLETTTDSDGRFILSGSTGAKGAFWVSARKRGFAMAATYRVLASRKPLTLRLTQGGTIEGRVLRVTERTPVATYTISAISILDLGEPRLWQMAPESFGVVASRHVGRPDGRFELDHLPAGRYVLLVEPESLPPLFERHGRITGGYDVADGSTTKAEVSIPRLGYFSVDVVDGTTGRSLHDVVFQEGDSVGSRLVLRNVSAREVSEGHYRVPDYVDAGGSLRYLSLRVACEGHAPVDYCFGGYKIGYGFHFTLGQGGTLSGTIARAGSDTAPGALVLVEDSCLGSLQGCGRSDSRGHFQIPDLRAGMLEVRVLSRDLARTLLVSAIRIQDGHGTTLGADGSRLGSVTGSLHFPGCTLDSKCGVSLSRDDPGSSEAIQLTPTNYVFRDDREFPELGAPLDPTGAFSFGELPTGDYDLSANLQAGGKQVVYLEHRFHIDAGEALRLSLEADIVVRGTVLDSRTGRPFSAEQAPGIEARMEGSSPPQENSSTNVVAADGSFTLRIATPGQYRLYPTDPERALAQPLELGLRAGEVVDGVRMLLETRKSDGRIVLDILDAATGKVIEEGFVTDEGPSGSGGGYFEKGAAVVEEHCPLGRYSIGVAAEAYVSQSLVVALTADERNVRKTVRLVRADAVQVTSVGLGSRAERAGLAVGDTITAYAGRPVKSLAELGTAMKGAPQGGGVSIRIIRDGAVQTLAAEAGTLGIEVKNVVLAGGR